MPANRPRGSIGGSHHFSRNPPVTPMSERQQLALLMQMTSQEEAPQIPNVQSNTSNVSRGRDRNERGETALHVAAIKGDLEQLNKLLEQGVNPNVADFAGWTPLHEACNHGWYTIALALVKAGANVNARGLDDDTPLHDAATNGQIKLVKFLVERGADPSFKNRKGKCPCDVAAPAVYNYLLAARDSSANECVLQTGRIRDDKKLDVKKSSDDMDSKASTSAEDVYDFKTSKECNTSLADKADSKEPDKGSGDTNTAVNNVEETSAKRSIDMTESPTEADEDLKRKKRKDSDSIKDNVNKTPTTSSGNRTVAGKTVKPSGTSNKTMTQKVSSTLERKSPCASPKPSNSTNTAPSSLKTDSDVEADDKTNTDNAGGLGFNMKVPPLKIVIPQSGNNEGDSGGNRNGKANSQRTHAALPYVVASNSNDSDKETSMSQCGSPSDSTKSDDKKSTNVNFSGALQDDRQTAPRVLRSSYRSGGGSVDRGSNNSSPQLQASIPPSPPSQPVSGATGDSSLPSTSTSNNTTTFPPPTGTQSGNDDPMTGSSAPSTSNTTTQKEAPVELHPRKRKIKASKESHPSTTSTSSTSTSLNQQDNQEPGTSEVHPHDQPVTNCYQMQLNIRKQIERRQKGLFPVQPKPPQGFKDYLMNRCTYALAGNTKEPVTTIPPNLPAPMKDIFTEQEHARYKLKMQHVVEKEKLVLAVEQEILRVHGRAARALANQAQPFSVCTILKDQEVYNVMTPEQEEKESSARSRYNGRLFLSWLQDVDDKWEKIKEGMLLRHQNEAESLHAVQKMDWEWQMKEHNLCDFKSQPFIDDSHIPLVHVSDDFDLLRA